MFDAQMELSFGGPHEGQRVTRRQRRLSRAQWWFERMRQIVEHAVEPPPAPPAEQIWFSSPGRQAG